MWSRFREHLNLWTEQRGVTALEYGILAALVASIVGLGMAHVEQAIVDIWRDLATALPPDGPTTTAQVRRP